jgi:MYXO-CTERM domain-containing protein
VNTTTGIATPIGSDGFFSAGDLAFKDGSFYMSATNNDLIRVILSGNTVTGGTDVGPFGFSNVFGLATADNDVLYGVAGTQIFSVDVATGHGTFVSDYGGKSILGAANGSAFITEAQSVPEPTALIMGGTASLIGLGYYWLRRRRRKLAV